MKFIETLLSNSTLKEAKLYSPALKASEDPTIGITIHKQAAYHVIKDCAKITLKYLPFIILEHYTDVFDSMRGKVSTSDVKELSQAAQKDHSIKQLMIVLLDKAYKKYPHLSEQNSNSQVQIASDFNVADPYGDYGTAPEPSQGNKLTDEEILLKAFS